MIFISKHFFKEFQYLFYVLQNLSFVAENQENPKNIFSIDSSF